MRDEQTKPDFSGKLERLNREIAIPSELRAEDGRIFRVTRWQPDVQIEHIRFHIEAFVDHSPPPPIATDIIEGQ